MKPNVWEQRWEKSRNRELGVLLIDWFDDMDDTYGWSFGELVCVCCGASIGCVEYVVWDVVLTIFFLSFILVFVLWQFGVFLFDFWLFFCKIQKVVFFWGKTRDSENTVLNIFFGFGVAAIWLIIGRCQAVKGKKGPRWMLLFVFSSFFFFCRGRDIFAKIKHTKLTYYSTFISRIQHKISIFSFFFFVKLMWWKGLHLFFISRFFFWPFFDLLQLVAMVRGTQIWASVGNFCFCFELFGFIRIYSVFSAGLAWGIMAKTLPEISSNWAFTLSKTGSIWALFKI